MRPFGRGPTLTARRWPAAERLWRGVWLYAAALGIVLSSAAPGLAQTDSPAPPLPAPARPDSALPAPALPGPDTAYFEFLRGRYYENQGKLPEALEAYERAAVLDPKSAQIRAEIAGLYARQNKSPEAVRDAKRALALDPKCTEAHWVLGTIYATMLEARREASSSSGPGSGPSTPGEGSASGADAPAESVASAGVERASVELAIEHLEQARPGRMFDNGLHVTLGRLYVARRNWNKAIQVLSFVVEREPEAIEAGYLLSQAYDGAGRRAEAIAGLEQVVAVEPRFFRALLDLADLYVRNRRWEAAADAYGRAATEYPDNLDLKLRRAAALANGGKAAEARDLLREVNGARSTDPRALSLLVDVERTLHNYDGAEQAARRLIELQPAQPFGAQALARVFADRRQYREVVATLEPVLAKMAESPDAPRAVLALRLAIGGAYQELREFDRAIAAFEAARRDAGDDAAADAHLAAAYSAAGQPARAAEIAAAARSKFPNDLRFVSLEAEARLKTGERDRALTLYKTALDTQGDDPQVHVAFGGLLLEARDFSRAEQVLAAAAQRFPKEISIPFQLGAVFEEQQRYDEAERAFRQALALDPMHAPTLNYLGYMYADRGQRLDEAVGMLKQAVDQDPYNGSYLDSLGWAYFKQGALDRARDPLLRASEQMPANSVVQNHVGDLLFALRDLRGAVAAWERALAGDGRSIERQAIEQKIERARAR